MNFIDLFAGCGGLSEGFYRQGFRALAHIEIDPVACRTLRTRMRHYGYEDVEGAVLELDITGEDVIPRLEQAVQGRQVDIIIGGPPCQAYSSLGRAKDDNGMQDDPRNYLFESYARVLNHFRPKLFVFENVTGMLTAKIGGEHIVDKVARALGENYKVRLDPALNVLNSANYGVPQIRKRVIIIGVRRDIPMEPEEIYAGIKKTHYDPEMPSEERGELERYVTVRDAIGELPPLLPGQGEPEVEFVSERGNEFLRRIRGPEDKKLRDHVARGHNDMDVQRYRAMSGNHRSCWREGRIWATKGPESSGTVMWCSGGICRQKPSLPICTRTGTSSSIRTAYRAEPLRCGRRQDCSHFLTTSSLRAPERTSLSR